MIKAVLFDLDDTLYDEMTYVEQALYQVALHLAKLVYEGENAPEGKSQMECEVAEGIVKQTLRCRFPGKNASEIAAELWEQMKKLLAQNGRGRIFNDICDMLGLTVSIRELVAIYRGTRPVLTLYADAEDCVKQLQKKGIKVGLITDGCSQVQHAKIDALGLEQKMDVVLATDDLQDEVSGKSLSKPDVRVYQYCLVELQCDPQEALYVGDNPAKDFVGAKKLGMHTIRILREKGSHIHATAPSAEYEAEDVILSLEELPEVLQKY